MKSLKDIRESSRKVVNEENKLEMLVQAGLLEENKLPLLKRAIEKDTRVLTPREQRSIMDLLENLVNQASFDIQEELKPAPTKMSDMPSILVLKRKAIRVYPGGQNVGLYYSQQLDRYVAVPFGPTAKGSNKVDDKSTMVMSEETQLDEVSAELRNATYAKRFVAAAKSKTDSPEQARHLSKAVKTMARTLSKKGVSAATKMQDFANKYKDADEDTQASYKKVYKKPKQKMPLPSKSQTTPPETDSKPTQNDEKPKKNKEKENALPGMMGTFASGGLMGVANKMAFNLGRKRALKKLAAKNPEHVTEEVEQVDEVVQALAGLAARAAGTRIGQAVIGHYLKKAIKKKLGFGDTEDNSSEEEEDKKSGNSSSREKKSAKMGDSPVGKGSKLRISTSSGLNSFRDRQQTLANMNQNQPQRRMQESVEVNLDGNKFQLNSTTAKKVQSVYESLNKTNRKKMLRMMNESTDSLNKVISFALRQ